jgi:peptidoglycan LD-endopeptidase CwlK
VEQISSRSLADLHPAVAEKAKKLIALCKAEGIDLLVTSTYRSMDEQADLYAQGRTKPGKKVTNAKPGASLHNHALAFDVVPLVSGKPVWNNTLWPRIGSLGESLGLTWGGRFQTFKDFPHFQFTAGLTLAEIKRHHSARLDVLTGKPLKA